uniref:hypothetical protein n=1 Tax=Halorhabdus rudnickae TaxID=1775544 RepID=UPI001083390F|nr:hypothetical protein [Halorhabdus rudnickae]
MNWPEIHSQALHQFLAFRRSDRQALARALNLVAGPKQRQFLGLVDVDQFSDDLVVGYVFDPEGIESLDGLLVEFD